MFLLYYTLTVYFGVVGRHGAINKYNVLAVLYTNGVFWCGEHGAITKYDVSVVW